VRLEYANLGLLGAAMRHGEIETALIQPQDIAMNSNIAAQRGTPVTLSIEAAQASRSLQSISSIQV